MCLLKITFQVNTAAYRRLQAACRHRCRTAALQQSPVCCSRNSSGVNAPCRAVHQPSSHQPEYTFFIIPSDRAQACQRCTVLYCTVLYCTVLAQACQHHYHPCQPFDTEILGMVYK